MKFSSKEVKQLKIFVLTAFGLPILMGILMGYSYFKGNDVSIFANAHMYYPAAGVMLALLVTGGKDQKLPKKFYFGFLAATVVMIAVCIASVIMPDLYWVMLGQYPIIIASIVCLILLLLEKKEVRSCYRLKITGRKNARSALYVLLFFALYLLRLTIGSLLGGQMDELIALFTNPLTYSIMFTLILNFFFSFTAFFGEEYGWRYFFQPLLQKRFGMRAGVLLLGIFWGLWHLPLNIFFYSPDTWLISVLVQIVTCISFSIFFGYGYLKTENIWVPVIMHYINNNMIAVVSGVEAMSDQVLKWSDVVFAVGLNLIFIAYIFSKAYNEKRQEASSEISSGV